MRPQTNVPPDHVMMPAVYKVRNKRREIDGVSTITLAPRSEGNTLPPPAPGQFAMLYAFGIGEIPISYSAMPHADDQLAFTIRDMGATSAALTRTKRGGAVGVRGPFGAGWPMDRLEGRDVLIVAGGLGLAPLRPVISALIATGHKGRSVHILYGARDPEAILFLKEIAKWKAPPNVHCRITVDTADPDWRGNVGLVTQLIQETRLCPDQTTALICGPEVMMRFSAEALIEQGLPPKDIWLSMERNMKCAVGFCGHCQFGGKFICKDGPVFPYDQIRRDLFVREL